MRIVFCWSNISGYMATCWRELARRPGVELHVMAYQQSHESNFDQELMKDIPSTLLDLSQKNDTEFIHNSIAKLEPDIIVLAGWLNPSYIALTKDPRFSKAKFVMGMDTPWRDTVRQRVAWLPLRPYLSKLSAVFVPGERAWQYARRLGVPGTKIYRGMYGIDWQGFTETHEGRREKPWPQKFLFAGRYHRDKGFDLLIEAYRAYRKIAVEPWDLEVCGMGPMQSLLKDCEGLTDHGFVQPSEAKTMMSQAGALVLPSRYDPWPLVVVEAAASGLPVVASEACGSIVELVRPHFNGLTVSATTTVDELAGAMATLSRQKELPHWGERSRSLAEPYAAQFWADRWLAVFNMLCPDFES